MADTLNKDKLMKLEALKSQEEHSNMQMDIRCVSPTLCLNEQMSKASLRRSISLSKQEKKIEHVS